MHAIPEILQPPDKSTLDQLSVAFIEIVGSKIVIFLSVRQQMVGNDQ